MNKLKLVGYVVTGVFVLNLLFFAFGLINWMVFWGIIILGAIFVYKVLPRLKNLK